MAVTLPRAALRTLQKYMYAASARLGALGSFTFFSWQRGGA